MRIEVSYVSTHLNPQFEHQLSHTAPDVWAWINNYMTNETKDENTYPYFKLR